MPTESIALRSAEDRDQRIEWNESSPIHLDIETRVGDVNIRHGVFRGGVSEGVEVVRMSNARTRVDVLPTRGMSIWRMRSDEHDYRWDSPVIGPVHPSLVPIKEAGGLGWLSGFDELVVRCGLHSNGAPDFDERGQLLYPLHGEIGNTPADALSVEFDEASGRVELIAETVETRLFFKRFRMRTRVRMHADRPDVELLDDVTNELSTPATMQLLYHINVGLPLLGKGSQVKIATDELAPRNEHAAQGIDGWNQIGAPESGFAEQVYFAKPRSDDSGLAHALLTSSDQSHGLGVDFKTSTLPYFSLWKNTAAETDGYVTGLEPATGFPNPRGVEESHGRLVQLDGGETRAFRVTLRPLTTAEAVEELSSKIDTLIGKDPGRVDTQPRSDWT